MSLYLPAYRLTLFAPKSVDARENTALTPVVGAPHSDAFMVASMTGLSGYQPYLGLPEGRKGRYTPLTGKVDIGSLTFRLLDKRTGTSNLERWVTAFVGDAAGKVRLIGRRVVVEESLDGGVTWTPFFVGRVDAVQLDDPLWYSITVRDPMEELNVDAFRFAPHHTATGSAVNSLLPLGLTNAYGPFPSSSMLTATYQNGPAFSTTFFTIAGDPNVKRLVLDAASRSHDLNVFTDTFRSLMGRTETRYEGGVTWLRLTQQIDASDMTNSQVRVMVRSGSVAGEYAIKTLTVENVGNQPRVTEVELLPLSGSDPFYIATSSFATGSRLAFRIIPQYAPVSENNPVYISRTSPVTILKDLAQGKYGYIHPTTNQPLKVIAMDMTALSGLATASFDIPRFRVTKKTKVSDFIEKYLHPFGVGYRIEPQTSGSMIVGALVPFDARLPTSLGLPTLTDADLADLNITWEAGTPLNSLTIKYYDEDRVAAVDKTSGPGLIVELEQPPQVTILNDDNADVNGDDLTIDALGLRYPRDFFSEGGESSFSIVNGRPTSHSQVNRMLAAYHGRYSPGAATVQLTCRRTETASGLQIGHWVLVNVSVLPNASVQRRGGIRLMQVVERSERGPYLSLRLTDAATNATTTAPVVGSLTTVDRYTLRVPVTASVGQWFTLEVAHTATTASRPADDMAYWWRIEYRPVLAHMDWWLVTGCPSGQRTWVRVNTVSRQGELPSAYVFPSGSGYYDAPVLTAPISASAGAITPESAVVSWQNNGDDLSSVHVALASPSGSRLTPVALLPPGTKSYTLTGLQTGSATNPYAVALTHLDGFGGESSASVVTFTATGSLSQWPIPKKLFVSLNGVTYK